jgi:hypothetical protein
LFSTPWGRQGDGPTIVSCQLTPPSRDEYVFSFSHFGMCIRFGFYNLVMLKRSFVVEKRKAGKDNKLFHIFAVPHVEDSGCPFF